MKFYTSTGPNPRVVKMFMAEKGVDIPRVEVDLRAGDYFDVSPIRGVMRTAGAQSCTQEVDVLPL